MSEPLHHELAAVVGASCRSMPGSSQEQFGGWLCRTHLGETARANSVSVVSEPPVPVAAAVDWVEQWYHSRGHNAIFQITGENPLLSMELDRRGYIRDRDSYIMTVALPLLARNGLSGERHRVVLGDEPTTAFASPMSPARLVETTSSPLVMHRYVDVIGDTGEVAGVGHSCVDGAFVGLFGLYTVESFRGQGVGTAALAALLNDATTQGATTAWLQVMKSNQSAVRLYQHLGFVKIGTYHYRHAKHFGADDAGVVSGYAVSAPSSDRRRRPRP